MSLWSASSLRPYLDIYKSIYASNGLTNERQILLILFVVIAIIEMRHWLLPIASSVMKWMRVHQSNIGNAVVVIRSFGRSMGWFSFVIEINSIGFACRLLDFQSETTFYDRTFNKWPPNNLSTDITACTKIKWCFDNCYYCFAYYYSSYDVLFWFCVLFFPISFVLFLLLMA